MDDKAMTYGSHMRSRVSLQTGLYILFFLLFFSPVTVHSGAKAQGLRPAAKTATAPFSRPGTPPIAGLRPKPLPVNRPVQITFRADPLLYAALSPDSKWIACISDQKGLSGLWLL